MIAASQLRKLRWYLASKHGFSPCAAPETELVGISFDIQSGRLPINGVRCRPENGTTGWYIWAGAAMPEDPGAFASLHVAHLWERCPEVLPYLELPPGWRFLIAPGCEDVWFDPEVDLSPT